MDHDKIPEEIVRKMAYDALGTCQSTAALATKYGVPEDEVNDLILDFEIETCHECGWWVESGELIGNEDSDDPEDRVGACDTCR